MLKLREILAEILSEEYREGHEDEDDDGEQEEEETADQFISDDDVDSGRENDVATRRNRGFIEKM